jgi:DNA-binding NarL/FixJ family response regulator
MMSAPEPITVWIIEDNRALRTVLAEAINAEPDLRCRLAVGCTEDLLAALGIDDPPDVALVDLGLPGESGTQAIGYLHGMSPATRAIVLTIHAEDDTVFEAICAGASGYLLKPSHPREIVAAIREVMAGAAPINPFIAGKLLAQFARGLTRPSPADTYRLSPRERGILELLVEGLPLKRIAERLDLSYHTIGNHLRNVYAKLHVHSRSSAVAKALRESLV